MFEKNFIDKLVKLDSDWSGKARVYISGMDDAAWRQFCEEVPTYGGSLREKVLSWSMAYSLAPADSPLGGLRDVLAEASEEDWDALNE